MNDPSGFAAPLVEMRERLRKLIWRLAGMLALTMSMMLAAGVAIAEEDEPPLAVGVLMEPAPYYSFSEETGEPIGFALDMWADVAKRAGLSYRLVFFDTLAELEKAAAKRSIDVAPLLAIDQRLEKLFDFSASVLQSPVSIVTRKSDSRINSESDLSGHRVSVVRGHVGQSLMQTYRGELSIAHDTLDEALGALMAKTSDAVVYQRHILWQRARQRGVESLLRAAGTPLRELNMAIAVRKGQPEVLAALAPALKGYLRSGAFIAAREPWGGNPPPLLPPALIAKVLGALLALAIVGLGLWRHYTVVRLNRALAKSVSEQKKAEERINDIAESASDWFFEQDEEFRFTFMSSRFEEMTGVSSSRLIGRTRWEDAAINDVPTDTEQWREHIATLKAHKDWRDFSYTFMTENGEKRTVTTSGKAIFDSEGQFRGYRGVGRDISRRIELEDALQQSQKMEMVGQLTGGIAHDFNNLLTVMVGNIEMLKRRLKGDQQSKMYLETTSEAVDIGAQLVQRLLGFSRRQALSPRNVDLNELVSNTLPLVRSSLGSQVSVQLDLADQLPPAFADDVQLQNILLNLAINARDAMPGGGALKIETEEVNVCENFVEQQPSAVPGRYLVLRVKDSGTGIEKNDLSKVIEPFFTTKEVGKGSGLGLSMAYGFAKQSKGFLLIDSAVGVGTKVSVYLPVAQAIPEPLQRIGNEAGDIVANGAPTGETVLVVEDDTRVREITVARLQHLGYHVLDAEDADAALAALEARPAVDLMLTDIVMPGSMSGIDLATKVNRSHPDVKILFSAGYSKQANELNEVGKLGPWLRKPYKQADLARKMREVLET